MVRADRSTFTKTFVPLTLLNFQNHFKILLFSSAVGGK